MIFTNKDRVKRYLGINKHLDLAINHILNTDLSTLENGRYELDQNNFFFVQEFDTKPESEQRYEAHGKRTDIQMVLSGRESYKVADLESLEPLEAFNTESDIGFHHENTSTKPATFTLNPYDLLILFPEDAHMPGVHPDFSKDAVTHCKKIVYKLLSE